MNEDTAAEQTETPLPAALTALSPEQRAALAAAAARMTSSKKQTISGSEAPVDGAPAENEGETATGKDVDWSEYDLPYNLKHLYPQATVRMTEKGPKWVVMITEFRSTERSFKQFDRPVNSPYRDRSNNVLQEPLNLGEYLNDMLNGPEDWHLVSVMPSGMGSVGVLLRRQVPTLLPDPVRLKQTTEVAAPRDVELTRMEEAALDFAASEGALADEENEAPQGRSLERLALDLNGPPARTPRPLGAHAEVDENTVADAAATIGQDIAQKSTDGTLPDVEG